MENKELIYLKGYAKGRKYWELLKAINCATLLHDGQNRKSGEPYIDHPIRVASSLIALNVTDEEILSTAVLHDVLEDCDIKPYDLEQTYEISSQTVGNVVLLSKRKGQNTELYYHGIRDHIETILPKVSDRCHNISTMAGVFTPEKIEEYILETQNYVLPLIHDAVRFHPEYSDALYSMKYTIESVIHAITATTQTFMEKETEAV